MQLLPDWRAVLRHAWSVRLVLIAGIFSGAEIAIPLLDGYLDIPRGVFAGLSAFTTCAAFIARLVAQKDINHAD